MLPRALAIHGITVGATVLALMLPGVMRAQLPDAPSAVKARQDAVVVSCVKGSRSHIFPQKARVDMGHPGLFSMPRFPTRSGSASMAREWAYNDGSGTTGQQSLYRPPKQTSLSAFSSATSALRPIPGSAPALQSECPKDACSLAQKVMCCGTVPSPFARYLKSPDAVPLTARDNLHSAVKNIIDPFNLLTIGADAAIGVASDSHSVYGPGVRGIAKYAGVSVTEDMTGEFFGTFLIPSLMHQDPHYHREPYVSLKRRVLHAVTQVVWTQSYTGQPMFNYANIVGGIATAAVSNTFVPGPGRQGYGPTAKRLAIAFAISPTGNLIEEFVPDLASRINLRVVIFQRILNTVSIEESGVP